MRSGKIVEENSSEKIYNEAIQPYTRNLISSIPVIHPSERDGFGHSARQHFKKSKKEYILLGDLLINRIRAGMVCVDDEKVITIKQRDPKSAEQLWSLPAGGIEVAETALEAAIRETREETGYSLVAKSRSLTYDYEFFWNGQIFFSINFVMVEQFLINHLQVLVWSSRRV